MNERHVDRRGFLQNAAVGAAGLSILPQALSAEDPKSDPLGGFTLGVQSYTFREFSLEQALKHTQDLGLKFAEFYSGHIPITDDAAKIKSVLSLCKDYGITPIAFGVEGFTKDHDKNKRKFEFAKAL